MRILFLCFAIAFFVPSHAQKPRLEFLVAYQLYNDTKLPNTLPAVLHIKDSVSIYEEKFSHQEWWDGGEVGREMPAQSPTRRTNSDKYLKIDHSAKELLSFAYLGKNIVLVTDNYPELKWRITDETKDISGFACIKATTVYRGREWTAWFTPQIAAPYGPWKLHGLPGLILDAYDADKKYQMTATKVVPGESNLIKQDFKSFNITRNTEPITYQQFMKEEDEAAENMIKEDALRGVKTTWVRDKSTRGGRELTYEWEE